MIQARLLAHSVLLTHSGLQEGGDPMNCGRQEQDGDPLISLHCAFGPHGEGEQGFLGSDIGSSLIGKHLVNGSPLYLNKQLQIGL